MATDRSINNIQTAETLPNVTLATGPGGVGACTQALFNAGQCLGTQNANVTFNGSKRARLWRGMGHHGASHSAADAELVGQLSRCALHQFHRHRRRRAICCPAATPNLSGTPIPAAGLADQRHRAPMPFGCTRSATSAVRRSGPDRALLLAEPLSGGPARTTIRSQQTSPYGMLNLQLDASGYRHGKARIWRSS